MTLPDRRHNIVIIAEDDPDDQLLIRDALKQSIPGARVDFVTDGAEMLDYLYHRGQYHDAAPTPPPDLVLLDLNMPRKGGMEVLEEIKKHKALRSIPAVVLTTSQSPEHVAQSYELGGNGYIVKPASYKELVELMRNLGEYWFETVRLP